MLLALSFPKFGHPAFGWIALAPLIIAAARATSSRGAFLVGFLAGAVYFWGTLYWLIETMTTFGGSGDSGRRLRGRAARRLPVAVSRRLCRDRGARRVAPAAPRRCLIAPFVWVTTELGRQVRLGRLPVGASRLQPGDRCCRSRRAASVVGVYGLSWLLALTAAAAAAVVLERRSARWAPAAARCARSARSLSGEARACALRR